jgi:hypothetical protein
MKIAIAAAAIAAGMYCGTAVPTFVVASAHATVSYGEHGAMRTL